MESRPDCSWRRALSSKPGPGVSELGAGSGGMFPGEVVHTEFLWECLRLALFLNHGAFLLLALGGCGISLSSLCSWPLFCSRAAGPFLLSRRGALGLFGARRPGKVLWWVPVGYRVQPVSVTAEGSLRQLLFSIQQNIEPILCLYFLNPKH